MTDIDPDEGTIETAGTPLGPASGTVEEGEPLTGEPMEAMRLRPEPPRVTRLSRKVLAGLGLVAGLSLGGALIYALQTRNSRQQGHELYATDNRTTPDGLASLPKDYTGVPKLGQPLPGDLGRPILNSEGAGPAAPTSPGASNPSAHQAEQRLAQEREAARTARLFVSTDVRPNTNASAAPPPPSQPDLASLGLAPQLASMSAQDRQVAFLNQPPDKRTVSTDRVTAPASPDILQAGSVIPAALITGIRSDLPGQITAQVTANVYDSPTGRILLIPQGTRVIGQYDNGVGFGQRRVLLVWNRLIFPNGRSIVLERQPGADVQGYAGLEDGVDYHWGSLFKAAVLSTILSVGAEAGTSQNENNLVQAIRSGASNSISQTGQQIVQRQLDVAPTLTIRPGFPVRVVVTRDLILEPYGG
ncbi:MAG: conjugal transfer protein TraI [Rhodobacteraceae bacterium]|nr:conjugal transfer protein TraI [Paracoccaceae bacterium]